MRKWTTGAADELIWANWGDAFVAYHRPSGRTHFLNQASYDLLLGFLSTPQDMHAIAAQVGLRPDENPDDLDELEGFLERFEELGLIRPL